MFKLLILKGKTIGKHWAMAASTTSSLMKAVLYKAYGGGSAALKHAEVPIPRPKNDEVLLKVEAVSLNPFDWKIQNGVIRPFFPRNFPHIPCTDVAGEVLEVGAEVKSLKVGDKVVTFLNHATGGGLAEYVVAKEASTVCRPTEVTAADSAALPVAALTAHEALTQAAGIKLDRNGPQSNILITAASGGKVMDITPANAATVLTFAFKKLTFSKKKLVPLWGMSFKSENLRYVVNLVKEGKVKSVIDSRYPLSKAEEAWAKSMDGHATGKIIVEP